LKKRIVVKQAAREASKQATFNAQQVLAFEVKTEASGAIEWFSGISEAKLKRMAPTHARITTPYVPLGMFANEQLETVHEIPLVAVESNRFGLPGRELVSFERRHCLCLFAQCFEMLRALALGASSIHHFYQKTLEIKISTC
jgi:hypothetical protein